MVVAEPVRWGLVLALALALPGCGDADAGHGGRSEPAFTANPAPWAFMLAGGCGFCSGQQGFDAPAEGYVVVLFSDGSAVRADLNGGFRGERAVHYHPDVSYREEDLTPLLQETERADGETWVLEVATGRGLDAAAVGRLHGDWDPGARDVECTDTGFQMLRQGEGGVEKVSYSCGPASGSMTKVVEALRGVAHRLAPDDFADGD